MLLHVMLGLSTPLFRSYRFHHFRLCKSLKDKLLAYYNLESLGQIQWGICHEDDAKNAFKALGYTVEDTGTIICSCFRF